MWQKKREKCFPEPVAEMMLPTALHNRGKCVIVQRRIFEMEVYAINERIHGKDKRADG